MWENDGDRMRDLVAGGVDLRGRWDTQARVWIYADRWRVTESATGPIEPLEIPRNQLRFAVRTSPARLLSQVSLEGVVGEEIDYENARPGDGATLTLGATVRPTDHLALRLDGSRRWIDVDAAGGGRRGRLFTAEVARLKATYTFTARSYLRVIAQHERTEHDPTLYTTPVEPRSGSFAGSALLAYKLNWQSVLFLGYGDDRTLDDDGKLYRSGRQLFLKLSYALQR
jgi:hypothetical protein